VGPQHLSAEQEKIQQATLFQRFTDGQPPLPGTQGIVSDMGVCHQGVTCGAVGFQGHDRIRLRSANLVPVQDDLERAQVDGFQDDLRRNDADRPFA